MHSHPKPLISLLGSVKSTPTKNEKSSNSSSVLNQSTSIALELNKSLENKKFNEIDKAIKSKLILLKNCPELIEKILPKLKEEKIQLITLNILRNVPDLSDSDHIKILVEVIELYKNSDHKNIKSAKNLIGLIKMTLAESSKSSTLEKAAKTLHNENIAFLLKIFSSALKDHFLFDASEFSVEEFDQNVNDIVINWSNILLNIILSRLIPNEEILTNARILKDSVEDLAEFTEKIQSFKSWVYTIAKPSFSFDQKGKRKIVFKKKETKRSRYSVENFVFNE